jgi:hypothetical protein
MGEWPLALKGQHNAPLIAKQSIQHPAADNFVQATPVFAILLVVRQVPAAPDDNRSANTHAIDRFTAQG